MPKKIGPGVAREKRLTEIAAAIADNPKLSQRDLATIIGVSKTQIDRDIDALQAEWRKERLELRDKLIEGHHWELMKLFESIRAKALDKKGLYQNLDIAAAVKILESDRKLLGLDAPAKRDITSDGQRIGGFEAATGLDDDTLYDIARGGEAGDLPEGGAEAS